MLVVWNDNTSGNGEILLAKSIDGKTIFGKPRNLSNSPSSSVLPDIAIHGTNVYVVWQENISGNGEILFIQSNDGGQTFSSPINISNNPNFSGFPRIHVNGNSVYVVWQDGADNPSSREVLIATSNDGGQTFSSPINISNNNGFSVFPTVYSSGNNVYVVWGDDSDGFDGIFIAKSADGGETFGTPKNVNGGLITKASFAFEPTISGKGNTIYIVWHQDPLGKRQIFVTKSTDGGETFNRPVSMSEKFDFSSKSTVGFDGRNLFVAWMVDVPRNNDVFIAMSMDGGKTFSKPINISKNSGTSQEPALALLG